MDQSPPQLGIRDSVASIAETITETDNDTTEEAPVLRLRLQKAKTGRKVSWTSETVDNEHMDKKKSKCCCVYHKPLEFGESSSESENDCDHCYGHVEQRKKKKGPIPEHTHTCDDTNESCKIKADKSNVPDPIEPQDKQSEIETN